MGEGFAGYKTFAIAIVALVFVGLSAPDLGPNFDPLRTNVHGSGPSSGSVGGSTSGASIGTTTGSGSPSTGSGAGSPSVGATNPLYTEASAIASNFTVGSYLRPSWGTGQIAAVSTDPTGNFRFICGASHENYDDPMVYPNQPNASHLHQYYGNAGANAYSTYSSLRTSGYSSCGNIVNRSAYWMPALLDGKGHIVQPDYVQIYYKRLPASSPKCNDPSRTDLKAYGICIPLPNGLRFTYGYDMLTGTPPTGHHHFACISKTAPMGNSYNTLADLVAAGCPAGGHIEAMIDAPDCWDGKNLDSANHRSHIAYASDGNWGYMRCDAAHPYYIPKFAMGAFYTIAAGDDLKLWHFSSDEMVPGTPAGTTFHADWFGGWDNTVEAMWIDNCINKHLNCSGGDLGNGLQIIGGAMPSYGWSNPNRLVPIPAR